MAWKGGVPSIATGDMSSVAMEGMSSVATEAMPSRRHCRGLAVGSADSECRAGFEFEVGNAVKAHLDSKNLTILEPK